MLTRGSFEAFRYLPTIVAAVLLVCLPAALLLVLTCCDALNTVTDSGGSNESGQRRRSVAEKFFYRTVSLIVGDWIEYNENNDTYQIQDRKIEHGVIILTVLFIYAVILVVFAIVTFFELFLFSTSSTCSTNSWTFCFPIGDNSAERIRNCTMLEGDVICYELELNIVTAAGVIGGLFTIINFLTTSMNNRVIKYYCNKGKRRKLYVILYILLLIILVVLLVIGCILGVLCRLNTTSDTVVFVIQYVSVILAILLGGFIPMISVLGSTSVNT